MGAGHCFIILIIRTLDVGLVAVKFIQALGIFCYSPFKDGGFGDVRYLWNLVLACCKFFMFV